MVGDVCPFADRGVIEVTMPWMTGGKYFLVQYLDWKLDTRQMYSRVKEKQSNCWWVFFHL